MKNFLLALFILSTAVLAGLVWHGQQKYALLEQDLARARAEQQASKKRADETDNRLASAEKGRSDAEAALKEARSAPAPVPTPVARDTSRPRTTNGMAALDNPAVQKMMAASAKASLDQRYGGLFRQLKLSPAELDKFKDLLTERQMTRLDVMRAAMSQGINPMTNPGDLTTLLNKAQADVDEGIRSLIGDQRFQQYTDFNQNISSYNLLDQVERRLSYTNAPLQPTQSDALLRVLIDSTPAATEGSSGRNAMMGLAEGFSGTNPLISAMTQRPISDETIAAAQSVLTPAQVEVLRQLQAEQKTQASTLMSMRASGTASGGTLRISSQPGTSPAPQPAPAER
jgi:hypothetical protein